MEQTPEGHGRLTPIDRNRELLKSAREETYKVGGDFALSAYVWEPAPDKRPPYPRSVAAFFFSSGWDHGQVTQFAPHCVYFASRGMTAIAFDYRVGTKHGAGPLEAMADARSAIRWIRMNAAELGINPGKIVTVGGSGGAHAITSAAMLKGYDDPADDLSISAVPNALVLFNPVLDTSKHGFGLERFPDAKAAKNANLIRAIAKGMPPMLLMHGTADRVVPFDGSYTFAKKMGRKKNKCRLIEFERQGHGFFNFNLSFEMYEATLMAMDEFLVELGFIEADPNAGLGEEGAV
ncbi:MAG: alpha/beta hydrolase [Verrucomicrobiaceae bacterium]|nr:alpha/beta hydrolase [Verrucomicrobiaceae bacterium]